MSDYSLAHMQSLNEYDFTQVYVMPLFTNLGFKGVRYVGGPAEAGRDVLCYEIDNADTRIDVGIQVKNDRIGGTPAAQEIIAQVRTAYENTFIDDHDLTEKKIGKFYVVTSRHITEPCKILIRNGVSNYPVYFMDGEKILKFLTSQTNIFLEYSSIDVLMDNVSITGLLSDEDWIEAAEEILLLLFQRSESSTLQTINTLPNVLIANTEIRTRVSGFEEIIRKSILHWLSIKLVLRAYYIMGKTSKFSLIEEAIPNE